MKKIVLVCGLFFAVLNSISALAEMTNVTVVEFAEKEENIEPYSLRYLFTDKLLRIDDNNDASDYVIYDDSTRNIYSVNHDDKTILVIEFEKWSMPKFSFAKNEHWKAVENTPLIDGNAVSDYWLAADETICVNAQVAVGFLKREAILMQRYQEALSSGQVKSIVATPKEMQTPCLLADQVYNDGSMYSRGFPVQQWHQRGLQRMMTNYKTGQVMTDAMFTLPEQYKRYSMGDDLTLGKPQ